MTKRNPNLSIGESTSELGDSLQQPLTAACNYIGAARVLLAASRHQANDRAMRNLDSAEAQILRAGEMVRRFQRAMVTQSLDD